MELDSRRKFNRFDLSIFRKNPQHYQNVLACPLRVSKTFANIMYPKGLQFEYGSLAPQRAPATLEITSNKEWISTPTSIPLHSAERRTGRSHIN